MYSHSAFMERCIALAVKGKGRVDPNPLVGAVLVYEGKIIGEGYHERFGGPHAEVNAINDAIRKGYADLLNRSVLFVSLEPCSHHGKTPPCADLIIEKKIPVVKIGLLDPNPLVNGKGMNKLKAAGIDATLIDDPATAQKIKDLLRPFTCFMLKKRPYVILKWAETADGFIGSGDQNRLKISNPITDRLVHKWRSETRALLIGKNTAVQDDPLLNNRYWPGPSPIRLVLAPSGDLPDHLHIVKGDRPTICFNYVKEEGSNRVSFIKLKKEGSAIKQILAYLYLNGISSLLVEGGATLLAAFITEEAWDEARIIRAEKTAGAGLPSPVLPHAICYSRLECLGDQISCYHRQP